jgi:hypothetical protein
MKLPFDRHNKFEKCQADRASTALRRQARRMKMSIELTKFEDMLTVSRAYQPCP